MTQNRINQIREEAEKRLNLWLINSTFAEMTCEGSLMRFEMALGLFGYSFQKEEWMDKSDFNKFVSEKEFNSYEYDYIIQDLFEKHIHLLTN